MSTRFTPALFHHAQKLLSEMLRATSAADRVVADYFRQHRELGQGDRGFVAEAVFSVLRRKRSLAARCAGEQTSRRLLLAALACLQRMNLRELASRPAHALSAGQKRRLGLARLLVTGRPVWLLDEPTVSLDTASVALFAGVLRDHLAQGGAALIATHIDLGLPEAGILDLTPYRAGPGRRDSRPAGFNEAFA